MNDDLIVGGVVVAFVSALVLVMSAGGNYVNYVSATAQIEQLRSDVQSVSAAESEDVIGQVTEANQRIARARRWNSVPVVGWLVPNGWDGINPIQIPKRK